MRCALTIVCPIPPTCWVLIRYLVSPLCSRWMIPVRSSLGVSPCRTSATPWSARICWQKSPDNLLQLGDPVQHVGHRHLRDLGALQLPVLGTLLGSHGYIPGRVQLLRQVLGLIADVDIRLDKLHKLFDVVITQDLLVLVTPHDRIAIPEGVVVARTNDLRIQKLELRVQVYEILGD